MCDPRRIDNMECRGNGSVDRSIARYTSLSFDGVLKTPSFDGGLGCGLN